MPANARSVTVGTTAVRAVNYDPDRTSLIVFDLGAATIYYGFNAEVTTATGIPIGASNNIVFAFQFGDDPTVERWLISGSAGNDIRIGEEWNPVFKLARLAQLAGAP